MEIKENFDKLSETTLQYIDMKIDNVKLHIVEKLSVMCNAMLSYLLVSVFVILAFVFFLLAMVMFLSPLIGMFYSVCAVAIMLAMLAVIIFLYRKKLFLDIMVRSFCRMFFNTNMVDDE